MDQPEESSVHEVIKYTPSSLPGKVTVSKTGNSLTGNLYDDVFILPVPAKHYDADTTEPISCGLCSMEELLSWSPSKANPLNVAVVPLAPREPPLVNCLRRTLVSHDMMGGYLDDRYCPYVFD